MEQMAHESVWMDDLDEEVCWSLLGLRPVGRVAYASEGGLVVVPVNHVMDGHAIVFRTGATELFERSGRRRQHGRDGLERAGARRLLGGDRPQGAGTGQLARPAAVGAGVAGSLAAHHALERVGASDQPRGAAAVPRLIGVLRVLSGR